MFSFETVFHRSECKTTVGRICTDDYTLKLSRHTLLSHNTYPTHRLFYETHELLHNAFNFSYKHLHVQWSVMKYIKCIIFFSISSWEHVYVGDFFFLLCTNLYVFEYLPVVSHVETFRTSFISLSIIHYIFQIDTNNMTNMAHLCYTNINLKCDPHSSYPSCD